MSSLPLHIKSGQYRALWLTTAAFTLCFAVWTIFSILGIKIKADLALTDTQMALLMALPILSGSLSRIALGMFTERWGGRLVFSTLMYIAAIATYMLSLADSYDMLLVAGIGLGLAGGGFIVGATYVVSWFETQKQGTALGIFGAGNVGAALTTFGAPFLLKYFSWQETAQIYALIIAISATVYLVFAKTEPRRLTNFKPPKFSEQLGLLSDIRIWRFALYYFFVFGAFVALALWLPHYLIDVYDVSLVTAGILTSFYIIPGSLFRILGGFWSDKYGARRIMYWTLGISTICTFLLSYPPTHYSVKGVEHVFEFNFHLSLPVFVLLIFTLGFFMSLGKAAVFKHIPTYFPNNVGVVGGLVSMVGGIGGFLLPVTFGMLNDVIGIWQSCFMLLFVISSISLMWMHYSIRRAERMEWASGQTVKNLPEMTTPDAFVLNDWQPENKHFWDTKGKKIATRNLWISIPNLFLAFAVWSIWSIMVVKMPTLGFNYSPNELFWLAALPALSGATLRIFYGFMIPIFGGRRWTALSTASLLIPCLWMGFALQNIDTPYLIMLILALLCGLGGANFSSSMANISFFYPRAEKGTALGLNAGLGNLGVSGMQLIAPLVISASVFGGLEGEPLTLVLQNSETHSVWLQNAAFIWVPFIIIGSIAAWFGMNDITDAKSSFKEQAVVFKRHHTWLMCWLYLGTFGSFIGFAAGFPLLSGMLFPDVDPVKFAFIGPLAGALARPVGGKLADKFGGAQVTLWNFFFMAMGVVGVLYFLPHDGATGNFGGFFGMFVLLFITTGIGNGSTFRMVPVMFLTLRQKALGKGMEKQAEIEGNRESAAVLGFISAIAAYGGFFIPKSYGTAMSLTGAVDTALYGFILFYASCVVITWWFYARRNAEIPC